MDRARFRTIPLLVLGIAGCGSPPSPLPPPRDTSIRIESVTEDQDEWLHSHCAYKGGLVVGSVQEAEVAARARSANFVEPLFRTTSSSEASTNNVTTLSTSASAHNVVVFACKEPVPW